MMNRWIIRIILFLFVLPLYSEAFRRADHACFTADILNKTKGTWIVDSFTYVKKEDQSTAKNKPSLDLSKIWKGKKLQISEKEIEWLEPIPNFDQTKTIQSCMFENIRSTITRNYAERIDCGQDNLIEFGSYCIYPSEEKYKQLKESPFDWNVNLYIKADPNSISKCNGFFINPSFTFSLANNSYTIYKAQMKIYDYLNKGVVILKKEIPIENLDFSKIENCEDKFEDCRGDCNGLVREDKSVLERLEGEWRVFAVNFRDKVSYPKLTEEERNELIGKKVLVTKDGFRFLTKLESYSRYFYEYYCPSKRALIIKNTYQKTMLFAGANHFDYFSVAGLPSQNPNLSIFIKTKKGIKEMYPEMEDTVLAIDNPCQLTIFDLIFVFYDKTMVLQMGGEFLYLKRVKSKK